MFRLKLTMKSTPKAECTKILKSHFHSVVGAAQRGRVRASSRRCCSTQIRRGVAAPLASTLAVGGQVIYFWLRAFVGHYHEGGMDPPPYAPFGAVVRHVALGLLVRSCAASTLRSIAIAALNNRTIPYHNVPPRAAAAISGRRPSSRRRCGCA